MKTKWDYSHLADAYLKRPAYSKIGIDKLMSLTSVAAPARTCDVGAGTAHLTLELLSRGLTVDAVEPNDAMRANGMKRTSELAGITWHEGTGEETGQQSGAYALVTFGSSFNVTDRAEALKETARLLVPGGWFACMWNHRDLDDPIQVKIENIIKREVAGYGYGTRREDQTEVIRSSELFGEVHTLEGPVLHEQSRQDCVEAWRSHATLARQAGDRFHHIVDMIDQMLADDGHEIFQVPYTTRIWAAQILNQAI